MTDEIKIGTLVEWETNPNYVGIVLGIGETCFLVSPFRKDLQKPVQPEQAWLKKYCKRTTSYKTIKREAFIIKGKVIEFKLAYDQVLDTTELYVCYK